MKKQFKMFKNEFKRKRSYLLVFTALLFVSFPAGIITYLSQASLVNQPGIFNSQDRLGALFFFSTLLAALLPFIFFQYKNSTKSIDLYHSLPVKRRDLFMNLFLLALTFVLIPLTINYFTGFALIHFNKLATFNWKDFLLFIRFSALLIAVMSISVFVIVNTGTLADSLIYTGMLFIFPFIAFFSLVNFMDKFIVGFILPNFNSFYYLSPLAAITSLFDTAWPGDLNILVIYWLLISLIIMTVSFYLFKAFPSEKSETPFVNQWFFPITSYSFVAFVFIFLLSINTSQAYPGLKFLKIQNLLLPIGLTFVVFMLLNIAQKRSLKFLKNNLFSFSLLIILCLMASSLIVQTQAFNYSYRIPKREEVETITIRSEYITGPFISNKDYIFTEKDMLDLLYKSHQRIIEKNDLLISKSNEYAFDEFEINFNYHLGKNKVFRRNFRIDLNSPEGLDFFEELQALNMSESVIKNNHPILDENKRVTNSILTNENFQEKLLTHLNTDELRLHLLEDLKTLDSFYSEEPVQYMIFYNYMNNSYQLPLDHRFVNSIAYLEKQDFMPEAFERQIYLIRDHDNEATGSTFGMFSPLQANSFYLEKEMPETFDLSLDYEVFTQASPLRKHDYLEVLLNNDDYYEDFKIPVRTKE